jgi:hypothetical protein
MIEFWVMALQHISIDTKRFCEEKEKDLWNSIGENLSRELAYMFRLYV